MINILKNLGIQEEDTNNFVDVVDNSVDKNLDGNGQYNEFSTFIEQVYKNCKKFGIPPSIIPLWVKDLLDWYSSFSNAKSSFSLSDVNEKKENDGIVDMKKISSIRIGKDTADFQKYSRTSTKFDSNLDDEDTKSETHKVNIASDLDPKIPDNSSSSSSLSDIEIPFVSRVSFDISLLKKEYTKFANFKLKLRDDINKLEKQKSKEIDNISQISQKEKFVISQISWFNELDKELQNNYSIKITDDIQKFSQLVNDFKEHGYNVHKIIQEYWKSLSLKLDIETNKANIQSLQSQRNNLYNSVLSLESRVNLHRQTMNIYSNLEGMGFGFKELKQLWHTIREIAEANNIPSKEVVSKFLKDIENEYDDKLGFESKIKEKKEELDQLNKKIINDRLIFRLQPSIGPTLSNLFQKGVTEQDIIGINQLVEICSNNTVYSGSNPSQGSGYNPYPNHQNENNNNNKSSRSEYWKSWIDELKSYGDIKSAMKKQQGNLIKIQQEIEDLEKQKQEISVQCQNGFSFINELQNKIAYFKGVVDYYSKDLENKIRAASRFSMPSHIFILYNNTEKERKDDKDLEDENR